MPKVQEDLIVLEHDVSNDSEYVVENPMISKTKSRPRGPRPKGGVEVARKPSLTFF